MTPFPLLFLLIPQNCQQPSLDSKQNMKCLSITFGITHCNEVDLVILTTFIAACFNDGCEVILSPARLAVICSTVKILTLLLLIRRSMMLPGSETRLVV